MPARKAPPEQSRSGSYVHEAQRGTVRVRIPRWAHERAEEIARRDEREVADVIVEAIERMAMPADLTPDPFGKLRPSGREE